MFGNFFSGLKNKAISMLMQKQLDGLPKEQQEAIIKMVQTNPELFEKIAKEIEEQKKNGVNELYAGMSVMKKYQSQIQATMGGQQIVRTVEKR